MFRRIREIFSKPEGAKPSFQYGKKGFSLGPKGREMLVFLFFLFVSFCFWAMQAMNEALDVEISVPLQLKDVPENVIITTELPPQLQVTIRDRGAALLHYFRDRELDTVEISFAKYQNGASTARVIIPQAETSHDVQTQLAATAQIISIRPDTLEFYYNRGIHRKLPVKLCAHISTDKQHYLRSADISPDSVIVYAPQSVLDTMRAAYTMDMNLKNLSHTTTEEISLHAMKGVRHVPESVQVTAKVDYYTEKTVEVPIIGLNFPADRRLKTFPSKAKVTFRVGSTDYANFNADSFVLAITYEELLNNEPEKFALQLKSLPEGISGVRIYPKEVDYLIEQSEEIENEEPGVKDTSEE